MNVFKRLLIAATIALAGSTFVVAPAFADYDISGETRIHYEDLPEVVRVTVDREVGDGFIEEVEKGYWQGQLVYEIEFEQRNGVEREFIVDEQGNVIAYDD